MSETTNAPTVYLVQLPSSEEGPGRGKLAFMAVDGRRWAVTREEALGMRYLRHDSKREARWLLIKRWWAALTRGDNYPSEREYNRNLRKRLVQAVIEEVTE